MASDIDVNLLIDDDDEEVEPNLSIYITEDQFSDFFHLSDQSAINVLHVNCRSLKKNFLNLKNLLGFLESPLSAIAVTETWLTESVQDTYILPGYNFFPNSRTDKCGGGVGLYVQSCFDYKTRSDLYRMTSYLECVFVEFCQPGGSSFLIGSVYRPPNTDINLFNSDLLSILNVIEQAKNTLTIIAGDFNLNFLNSHSHAPTNDFLTNMMSYNFIPTISNPTRISDNSSTLIDNIFVNCIKKDYSTAIVYNDISDHLPVALHLTNNVSKILKPDHSVKRFFDAKSIANFNAELANTNWDCVDDQILLAGPCDAYTSFLGIYQEVFDKHFPVKTTKLSNRMTPRHGWMTKGLTKSCVRKSKLYRAYCKNRCDSNKKSISHIVNS